MPRTARHAPGGTVFHVLNRGMGRIRLFAKDGDFRAFERAGGSTAVPGGRGGAAGEGVGADFGGASGGVHRWGARVGCRPRW